MTKIPSSNLQKLKDEALYQLRPFFRGSVYDWCTENLWNDPTSESAGRFNCRSREYMIEPINDWNNPYVQDEALCWGAQLGKTTVVLCGMAFTVYHTPTGIMWVMDSEDQARGVSRERWQPLVSASPVMEPLIPTGRDRHDWGTLNQIINGAVITLVGSNSAGKLASRPKKKVVLDEVDKFPEQGAKEASAVYLAELRTKSFSDPYRFKSSTPTRDDGAIWQEYKKGDQRRYFVDCPHCQKEILIVWQKNFTSLPLLGCESEVKWDKEAKVDGAWDFSRVEASAHVECCHCQGKITDHHKGIMNRGGRWKPTNKKAKPGFVSRHLPSWYAPGVQTSYGKLAVKFLEAKNSLDGLQGFVNSECAEPWESQDTRIERVEIITGGDTKLEGDTLKLLTIDYQMNAPHFWYIVREHQKDGLGSVLVDKGSFNDKSEIKAIQGDFGIPDNKVAIDSGYQGENGDEQFIFDLCVENSQLIKRPAGSAFYRGFIPLKGFKPGQTWVEKSTGMRRPYALRPVSLPKGRATLYGLYFDSSKYKDYMVRLRRGETDYKWALTQKADKEYFTHLDAEYKKATKNPRTGRVEYKWVLRSRTIPNHLLDCENHQLAMAAFLGILNFKKPEIKTKQNTKNG